jgi:hypothetical protein
MMYIPRASQKNYVIGNAWALQGIKWRIGCAQERLNIQSHNNFNFTSIELRITWSRRQIVPTSITGNINNKLTYSTDYTRPPARKFNGAEQSQLHIEPRIRYDFHF